MAFTMDRIVYGNGSGLGSTDVKSHLCAGYGKVHLNPFVFVPAPSHGPTLSDIF